MKIEQHMYTRARRTLFQQSEGYGTVAKTDGLSDAFIKEEIHPYCVYPATTKSQNYTIRPKAVTLVHYPCGRMLLGQAVYKEKDFTGQRATFFVHNYIFPPQMVDGVLRDFENLKHMEFLTEYESGHSPVIESGSVIAGLTRNLNVIDCKTKPTAVGSNETWPIIFSMKIAGQARNDESCRNDSRCVRLMPPTLQQILQCATASVHGIKKTYIIVPVPLPQMHDYVWALLTDIYAHLPEETRHKLGFCTYARQPMNKKGIHLIFLENGTTAKFANDYVIDLNNPTQIKITSATPKQQNFPQESEFWHIRTPHRHDFLLNKGREWINTNLDKLTLIQLASIPGSFIIRGKGFRWPELYVILGILKTCAGAISTRTPIDLRYLLGSYSLLPQDYFRVVQNLRRLFQNHITPANYENIVFLFRANGKGRVDITGLESYLEKFATSAECKEAVMLLMR